MNKTVRRINFPYCRDCVFLSVMFIHWLLSHNRDTLNSHAGPHPALTAVAGEARGEFGAGADLLKTCHPAPRTWVSPVPRNASHPAAAAPAEALPTHHTDEPVPWSQCWLPEPSPAWLCPANRALQRSQVVQQSQQLAQHARTSSAASVPTANSLKCAEPALMTVIYRVIWAISSALGSAPNLIMRLPSLF